MKIIHYIKRSFLRVSGLLLAVGIITAWFLAGASFPGRYQIIGGGQEAVTMVDTMTGKIRVFVARRIGTESYGRMEGSLEFIELTK